VAPSDANEKNRNMDVQLHKILAFGAHKLVQSEPFLDYLYEIDNIEGLRELTEHLDIFLFPPIIQWCSISDVLFTGGRGVSDFSVLKYYWLNINYSVNILNECLRILIDCSQLSKTYYVLFGSSTRDRHARQETTYVGGRSENNIKCVVHDDIGRKNQTTRYILPRDWLHE